MAGVVAGAGGGLCQVSIMGPCTFLVTGAVTGDRSVSTTQRIQRTWTAHGFKARPEPPRACGPCTPSRPAPHVVGPSPKP